ncbi:MAG: hypothetical protein L0211_18755 [Planctomycetaceae bacterium]|nr:hypothetical protein [Planctomycetaceae bacterium]
MADYIPRTDANFDAWQTSFVAVVNGNLAGYGLVAGDMTPVTTAQTAWNSGFSAQQTAQAAAEAATQTKDANRETLTAAIRALVRKIQATPSVSDTDKAAAGITVPDTTPTPSGPPATAPVGKVDTSQRLQHTIHFSDSATPTSKAKPAGVRGCEIWMKVGTPPPTSASDLAFVTLDTRTPHVIAFDGADANKTITYWLRWVSTRGETGPWSAAVSATVSG